MAKVERKAAFFCSSCGNESPQWMGFCRACGSQQPLVVAPTVSPAAAWVAAASEGPAELATISTEDVPRIPLNMSEVDRVLGGGLVPGSVVLMAGDPGIGKSTLVLQLAASLCSSGRAVFYISGEESAHQIKGRADRLGIGGKGLFLLGETSVEAVLRHLDGARPAAVVVDSIQTMYCEGAPSTPGSVAQVRESARLLLRWAKARNIPLLLVGHVTKEGEVAGPRVLEHMVDAVLYLEGDSVSALRILRGVKNRFGSTNEVAVLAMTEGGLQEVPDPSAALLGERRAGVVGSVVTSVMQGSRPILVEVQALTAPSSLPAGRRTANGVDQGRLVMLAAVLAQRLGLPLAGQDVIVNVVGGLEVQEPAADLAVALAIASSVRGVPVGERTVAIGELGLSGELRRVPQLERRLREAARLGFTQAVVPASATEQAAEVEGLTAHAVMHLREAAAVVMPRRERASGAADLVGLLRNDAEAARIVRVALDLERQGAAAPSYLGWEWHQVQAAPAKLRQMVLQGLLQVGSRSASAICYRLTVGARESASGLVAQDANGVAQGPAHLGEEVP